MLLILVDSKIEAIPKGFLNLQILQPNKVRVYFISCRCRSEEFLNLNLRPTYALKLFSLIPRTRRSYFWATIRYVNSMIESWTCFKKWGKLLLSLPCFKENIIPPAVFCSNTSIDKKVLTSKLSERKFNKSTFELKNCNTSLANPFNVSSLYFSFFDAHTFPYF